MYDLEVEHRFDRMWLSARDTVIFLEGPSGSLLKAVEIIWNAYETERRIVLSDHR